jgi:hypothetical protein
MLLRVTAKMPENGEAMGKNMERGDIGQKQESVALLDTDTYVAPCYNGNA